MRHMAEFVPGRSEWNKLEYPRSRQNASEGMTRFVADHARRHNTVVKVPPPSGAFRADFLTCEPHRNGQGENIPEKDSNLKSGSLYGG